MTYAACTLFGVGGGYSLAAGAAAAPAAGADCGCYWKKLCVAKRQLGQLHRFFLFVSDFDFDFALSLVLFALHVVPSVWRYLL